MGALVVSKDINKRGWKFELNELNETLWFSTWCTVSRYISDLHKNLYSLDILAQLMAAGPLGS